MKTIVLIIVLLVSHVPIAWFFAGYDEANHIVGELFLAFVVFVIHTENIQTLVTCFFCFSCKKPEVDCNVFILRLEPLLEGK